MLLPDQEEFFRFFEVTPPPGMSVDGARRFMESYLKDPARLKRWQQRPGAASATPPAPKVVVPPMAQPRAAVTAPAPPAQTGGGSSAGSSAAPSLQPFRFTGSGGEYFGIWIVNLVLTILTLGIYSAWAKVRRLQYFYRHTEVAGATFDYHGDPIAILKGRLIAVGLLVLWNWAGESANLVGFIVILLIAAALPWLLRNSFRFRMRNSSYRGLRFRFTGSTGGSYGAFLWRPLLAVFTLYLAWPWAHQRLKQYQHGNAWFGKTGFSFGASVGAFYKEYAILGLASLAVFIVPLGMLMTALVQQAAAQTAGTPMDPRTIGGTIVVAVALMMLGSLLIAPLFQARMQNVVWNNTALGPHAFRSDARVLPLLGIHVTNTLLVVLTLGFFMPWAAVRIARYRVEALTLVAADNLDAVVAEHEQELGATGEETAEMFDIDIAL